MTHQSLTRLSDKRLLARLDKLTSVEHRVTVSVLLHLNEVDRRKLYLKLGFGSLFEYCTESLRYSSTTAGRRILSALLRRRYPKALTGLNDFMTERKA